MNKIARIGLVILTALSFQECQKVPEAGAPGGYVDDSTAGDSSVQLCPDGTLNCYIVFPDNTSNTSEITYGQSYEDCLNTCLAAANCNVGMPSAVTSCPTAYAQCDAQCNLTDNDSAIADMPESDGLTLPTNPKAVLVDIEACYTGNGNVTELHFQGPNAYFVTPIEGSKQTVGGAFGNKEVRVGYGVGRSSGCSTNDLKNRINVTFTPLAETSVTLNDKTITIVPFSSTSPINKTYKATHSVSFGIPVEIRNEVDLSEIAWIAKEFHTPTPNISYLPVLNGFYYYNNDIPYGNSIALVGPSTTEKQKITMYLFIKSN